MRDFLPFNGAGVISSKVRMRSYDGMASHCIQYCCNFGECNKSDIYFWAILLSSIFTSQLLFMLCEPKLFQRWRIFSQPVGYFGQTSNFLNRFTPPPMIYCHTWIFSPHLPNLIFLHKNKPMKNILVKLLSSLTGSHLGQWYSVTERYIHCIFSKFIYSLQTKLMIKVQGSRFKIWQNYFTVKNVFIMFLQTPNSLQIMYRLFLEVSKPCLDLFNVNWNRAKFET